MTKGKLLLLASILGLAGCTDSVDTLTREYRATTNEAIDAMMMITNETQAARMAERILKPMGDRYKAIDRKLGIVKDNRGPSAWAKEVLESDGMQLYLSDLHMNIQRYGLEMTRLRNLRKQILDRERELLIEAGDANPVIKPELICPKLDALVMKKENLDVLEKQLMQPDLVKEMSSFPTMKGATEVYDKAWAKFAERRATFLPQCEIKLVH